MLGRIAILFLVALAFFVSGMLFSRLVEWEKFLGPLAIAFSALFATTLAVRNIEQSRHHEVVKRTLDIIDKKPPINKALTCFRNRINDRICTMRLYEKDINKDNLHPVILSLKSGETNIARAWLKYVGHIYIGLQQGIYDKEIIESNLGSLPVNVWRDFWPIAKYQELTIAEINEGYFNSSGPEYWASEAWAVELTDGKDLTREVPKYHYKPLDED